MHAKEAFKDKPAILAALKAFEDDARTDSPVSFAILGGVAFGHEEGPRMPSILVEAYAGVEPGHRFEQALAKRKQMTSEKLAVSDERMPAQTPLGFFEEAAAERHAGNLSDEKLQLLEEACVFMSDVLPKKGMKFNEDALRGHRIVI